MTNDQISAWDKVLRRAEHEVNYMAKRAVEMYIEVWEKDEGKSRYLFEGPISKHWFLEPWQIEHCVTIMKEAGLEK